MKTRCGRENKDPGSFVINMMTEILIFERREGNKTRYIVEAVLFYVIVYKKCIMDYTVLLIRQYFY